MASVHALGLSGGLLATWDLGKAKLKAFVVTAGILLTSFSKDFIEEPNLKNVYGPYNCKNLFWDSIYYEGTFDIQNLIIVGDLNFIWSPCEFWGSKAKMDSSGDYFVDLFGAVNLVDVEPNPLNPTRINGQGGLERVSKRLDIFLMSRPLMEKMTNFR